MLIGLLSVVLSQLGSAIDWWMMLVRYLIWFVKHLNCSGFLCR